MDHRPLPPPRRAVDPPPSASERAELDARLARLAARRSESQSSANLSSGSGAPSTARGRRRHPAARARLAALGLSVASTAGLTACFALGRSSPTGALTPAHIVSSAGSAQPSDRSAADVAAAGSPDAQATSSPGTTVVDGSTFHNRWGNVQIEATFDSQGTLVDVVALQTPNSRQKSVRINDVAIPRLTAEAVDAQSASVDSISGATYTSADYSRSLQSAIDIARAEGATQIT